MKSKFLLILSAILLLVTVTNAQQSPADSLNAIKQQKRILDVAQRIEESKLKLTQLEKELADKNDEKEKAVRQAQESANENRDAAVALSDDSQHRKKAKRADKRSDQARRDAKRARRATDKVNTLEKDISRLKEKIAKDEERLSKMNSEAPKQ